MAVAVAAPFMDSSTEFPNRNPSLVGSEYLKFGKIGSTPSVNLSEVTRFKGVSCSLMYENKRKLKFSICLGPQKAKAKNLLE